MRTLFLEGASGISGDMTVGALLDLGGSEAKMRDALASLPFGGYSLDVSKTSKWGLSGTSFTVHLHEHHSAHHSPLAAHHSPFAAHHSPLDTSHEPRTTSHEPRTTSHEPRTTSHEHRHLSEVNAILDAGNLTDRARALAKRAFLIVAEAEAKAHGTSVDEVHFHEVGAVDSICDIAAAAVLADDLGVTDCVVTGLSEGAGLVECAHGALPVPVPAVANIAAAHSIPLRLGTAQTELVTPTGIALAAALRTRTTLPPCAKISRVGVGFGTREIGRANVLRAMFIEMDDAPNSVVVIEANVDDSTGEQLGVAMEKLFAAGALDCSFSPCFMKKCRPAWLVRVIADESRAPALERILFAETNTIGVRRHRAERTVMSRSVVRVALPFGEVDVKRCEFGGVVRFHPEAESVRRLADAVGRPFADVMSAACVAAEAQLGNTSC